MSTSICDDILRSRRGLLALLWSIVSLLTFITFLIGLFFTFWSNSGALASSDDDLGEQNESEKEISLTVSSRAITFAAIWTAVLACLMSIFGTVILGFQSPTGQYYSCCASNVLRTSPLGLGSFIGALLMFANLTLVCSVFFGEFEVWDGEDQQAARKNENDQGILAERSPGAFSIMCMFLTVIYLAFAATAYVFSNTFLEESESDEEIQLGQQHGYSGKNAYSGYIDNRFDIHPASKSGFVGNQGSADSGLT